MELLYAIITIIVVAIIILGVMPFIGYYGSKYFDYMYNMIEKRELNKVMNKHKETIKNEVNK